jgi:hypothetical protein
MYSDRKITLEDVLSYLTVDDNPHLIRYINQVHSNRQLNQRLLTWLDNTYITDILQEGEVEHLYLVTSLSRAFLSLGFICQTPEADVAFGIIIKLFHFLMALYEDEHTITVLFEYEGEPSHFINTKFEELVQSDDKADGNTVAPPANICWEMASFFQQKRATCLTDEDSIQRQPLSHEERPAKRRRLDEPGHYVFTGCPLHFVAKHGDAVIHESTSPRHENPSSP